MFDRRLLALPGAKKLLIQLLGLTIIEAFAIIAQAFGLAQAIVGLWQGQHFADVSAAVLLFVVAYAVRQLTTYARNLLSDGFGQAQSEQLRTDLLQRLYRLGPSAIAEIGSGAVVTQLLAGSSEIQAYLALTFNKLVPLLVIPIAVFVMVSTQSLKAGIALLLLFPVIIGFMVILGLAAKDQADVQYAGFAKLTNHFQDALRGMASLDALGVNDYDQQVYTVSERFRKQTMKVLKVAMLSGFAMDFFATLAIAVVAVFLGLDLLAGRVSLMPALLSLILAPEYFLPIRAFGADYHATLNGKTAFEATQAILVRPLPPMALLPVPQWDANSTLAVKDLAVSYSGHQALSQVSFTLSGFQKVAIIGASGSGKTTLLNTIAGFLTPDGAIDLNGVALNTLNQSDWQQQISYIPQSPYIFADTIAANINFYQPQATREQINRVATIAGLQHFLTSLPEGLNTRIGAGGRGISGGQAQRIALARTLLDTNRAVWLFDEPTAHLDIETELALKKTMTPLFDQHLVIMATHRLHWLSEMDLVLVMAHGKLVDVGTPQALAKHSVAFQQLVQTLGGGHDAEN
ncbi:thiol reductant ABC exporter subunit CydD [Lacticaseibacillus porcinae]|uniref:thiol reductant ABC exporter subunit CydD n=1 Tax=Lacticaseibacillus porcinae TaxID=1123687 RepID=UPI000F77033C|nr:thiol reductant ABC exporter subunit CydD [Lacticaseibacillus porcinae]